MTVIGVDDTDSRERGMCTTYLAARLGERVESRGGALRRRLLVRLNPAVPHKTRGNAALALHADVDPDVALRLAREELSALAVSGDPDTSPGVVVADVDPSEIPSDVAAFARDGMREFHDLPDALDLIESHGWRHDGFGGKEGDRGIVGRGRIGALAAIGAWRAFDDWTAEHVAYRQFDRCGTPREVDRDSVFAAADRGYPTVWDTVDRGEGEAVCVPSAPGPILFGIRGDDPEACRAVAAGIDAEPIERTATFLTNQGTDAHLAPGEVGSLRDGAGYCVDGVVATDPETRRGGHVFFDLAEPDAGRSADPEEIRCAAFEPTKRFRDRVRALRPGDRLTVCGELAEGTLKLEKFAIRELVETEPVNPTCPDCGRSMPSAGREQGYRCRDCGTHAERKATRPLDRALERGWYEVPPCARRHVAKPLVRGGFDAPVHPER
ncbi:MAG: tRNA(Ile)(2)-agmatinylcytidine synthase [Haloferacaceae archaeon]